MLKKIVMGFTLLSLQCGFGLMSYATQSHNKTSSDNVSYADMSKNTDTAIVNDAEKKSILQKRIEQRRSALKNPLSIALYNPTYVLPYYYTASPYREIYQFNTPNNQEIMKSEFKSQLSFLVPIVPKILNNENMSLNIAYTQLNFWQVYAKSQYFRETNYEPEVFFEDMFHSHWLFRTGLDHQSNGRGGDLERSWNRAYGTLQSSWENWLISLKVWGLIFKSESSDLHNPDIAHFLGHDSLLFSYRLHKATLSLQTQNIESGFKRGMVEASISYPVLKHISLYAQYYNGYGQSLIEYNHRTQGLGIGIAFNDWL